MKIAIIHEWLLSYAGSERCLKALKDLFPNADIYTSIYNENNLPDEFKNYNIKTTFIDKLPFSKKKHFIYYPLMPIAFENIDLSGYDIVISSSHACAKGIITNNYTKHISYIYTPTRYLWSHYHEYLNNENSFIKKQIISLIFSYMRLWDFQASQRPDILIADSINVANRIKKYYKRDSLVIYPPINLKEFKLEKNTSKDFYLMVGRLVAYKRFDLAINTFNKNRLKLKIAGIGPEYKKLKSMSNSNIEFLGYLDDKDIKKLYANAKALIFPAEEDFGIVPVEAQASGTPVIAYAKGGALETVKEYQSGMFFKEQTISSLEETIKSFERRTFLPEKVRENILKFDVENFNKEFKKVVLG
jgi:glycosyltransferase involved in cell wall biosynthesis